MGPAHRDRPVSSPPDITLTRGKLPLRVVHSSPEMVLGALGNIHMSIYRVTPSVDLLRIDQKFHEALAAETGKTVVFTVTAFGISLPDADARTLAAEYVRKNRTFVQASATLTEGDGFWASAARSAVTAVFLLAKQPYPSRVFGDVMEAGNWVSAYAHISGLAIRDAVRELERS